MSTTATPVDNGVNVGALLEAREALTQMPEAAQFTWRPKTTEPPRSSSCWPAWRAA